MNLQTEPLLPVLSMTGDHRLVDLPGLLSAYSRYDVLDLPFLRPHQRSPWHSFTVALAAIGLHRAGEDEPPYTADDWRALLRALTADWPDDEPWRLVVDDLTKPAFMQPPIPPGMADPHKTPIATPDDLDILVTAKNHGIKRGTMIDGSAAAWAAALVVLQTCGDYSAAGSQERYYGSVRRNGSDATRPFVGLVPLDDLGAHWRRDLTVLLRRREWFFKRVEEFAETDGAALLWCLPWNGQRSLELAELDPWFIEICRRVRLYRDGGNRITARSTGSKAARITAKYHLGNVGDPWIPINLERSSAAYNTTPTYDVMSAVLFDRNKWHRPLLLDWHDDIDRVPMTARFDITVRGRGKTEGQHLREVPIDDERKRWFFMSDDGRQRLAEHSDQMIKDIGILENTVLKDPLLILIQAGNAEVNPRDRRAIAWIKRWRKSVEQTVEARFFDHLFVIAETASYEIWGRFLQDTANAVFGAAVRAVPIAGARRLKAIAVAELKLCKRFRDCFGGYLSHPEKEMADVD